MSLQGAWGFYKNGESFNKITNYQMNSYPEFLGQNIVDLLRNISIHELNMICDFMNKVDVATQYPFTGNFIRGLLFYEWVYVINLDTNELEIYKGMYGKQDYIVSRVNPQNIYYSCKVLIAYPLDKIPENWLEEIVELSDKYHTGGKL